MYCQRTPVLTAPTRYPNIFMSQKDTRGVSTREIHSSEEVQTRPLCVNAPPELYVELQIDCSWNQTKSELWTIDCLEHQKCVLFVNFVCMRTYSKCITNTDRTTTDNGGCSHATNVTRGLLATTESKARKSKRTEIPAVRQTPPLSWMLQCRATKKSVDPH